MPETAPALGGEQTVLVVENQAEIRERAVTVLKACGYRVVQAWSAGQAPLRYEREPERIDLVLTGMGMPDGSGRELANRLDKLQPGIRVLLGPPKRPARILAAGQDGIETIQALREQMPGIGIIAISQRSISQRFEAPYLKMAGMLGADAVLAKPIGKETLLAKVAEVLKSRR